MSYYFPFGIAGGQSVQNINYALSAISASAPEFATISVSTASYVQSVQIAPENGTTGTSRVAADCPYRSDLEDGPRGLQGDTGSKGTDVLSCPPGTKACPDLYVSLSVEWSSSIGGPRGVNFYRPSGSQFSIVCIQTAGYIASTIICPASLPTSSQRLLPLTP